MSGKCRLSVKHQFISINPAWFDARDAGVLRFGAGAVLAIGVSLVTYSYFEKQGLSRHLCNVF